MEAAAKIIGLVGVGMVMLAYGLISFAVWRVNEARYVLLNLFGTCAILFSLIYAWNLPGFALNVAWVLISLYALWRIYKGRRA